MQVKAVEQQGKMWENNKRLYEENMREKNVYKHCRQTLGYVFVFRACEVLASESLGNLKMCMKAVPTKITKSATNRVVDIPWCYSNKLEKQLAATLSVFGMTLWLQQMYLGDRIRVPDKANAARSCSQ